MRSRILALSAAVAVLSGCSGLPFASHPAVGPTAPVPLSAVRLPASEMTQGRHTESLGVTPSPLTALAWPLTALAWPLTALAWPGAPSATTTPCAKNAGQAKKTGEVECKAMVNTSVPINPDPNAPTYAIPGVQPGLLRYIYNLPQSGGDGQTVGIVVAQDDPNAEADLAVYRTAFGLSPCTSANGCFTKIAGAGKASPVPAADANWSVETALDLDAVSAACPQCKIMLVESASDQIPDLATAVDTAVANGATVVNSSYGVAEAADNVQYESHWNHPGVPMTASAGDVGYGPQFPASSPHVTSVGGTSIVRYGLFGIAEVAWSNTGAGCSAFFPKPVWQTDTGCTGRTLNDVAMLADPTEGLAVYDSTLPGTPSGGWSVIGGTSLGSALVAALYALAANGAQMGSNAGIYAAAAANVTAKPELIPITAGSDGSCPIAYLCAAQPGYNGPAGNGVPWGIGAFAPTP